MLEAKPGSPGKGDTMNRLQVEIASANSRAGLAPMTPPEDEILRQAMRTSYEAGFPTGPTPRLEMSGTIFPPVPVPPAVPAPTSSRHDMAAAQHVRGSPIADIIARPMACNLPLPAIGGGNRGAGVASQDASRVLNPAPPPIPPSASAARPSWLGVARRLPPQARAAISTEMLARPSPTSESVAAPIAGPTEAALPAIEKDVLSKENLKKDLQEMQQRHARQLEEIQRLVDQESSTASALLKQKQSLDDQVEAMHAQLHESKLATETSEKALEQCRGEISATKDLLSLAKRDKLTVEAQAERQRAAARTVCSELQEEVQECVDAHRAMEESAEQERNEKVRAIQEARAYQALLQSCDEQVRDLELQLQSLVTTDQQCLQLQQDQHDLSAKPADAGAGPKLAASKSLGPLAEQAENASNGLASIASNDGLEVKQLRAQLANKDQELLAAAASQRRFADQSEKTAAALRAKLTELEAVVAATPKATSCTSCPRHSDRSDASLPGTLCIERAAQTEVLGSASMPAAELQCGSMSPHDVFTPHFSLSPSESPSESPHPPEEAAVKFRAEFAGQLATVLKEGEGVATALRVEISELQRQNHELHQCVAAHKDSEAAAEERRGWDALWQNLLEPLRTRCNEEQRARAVAEREALRWRSEFEALQRDTMTSKAEVAAMERQTIAVQAVAQELHAAKPLERLQENT